MESQVSRAMKRFGWSRAFVLLAAMYLWIQLGCGGGDDGPAGRATGHVNSPPTASFTVTPAVGTTATVFQFDASGSSDRETPAENLQVRWDWENNGEWDTEFTTTRTASHRYDTPGTKTIRLEVRDDGATRWVDDEPRRRSGGCSPAAHATEQPEAQAAAEPFSSTTTRTVTVTTAAPPSIGAVTSTVRHQGGVLEIEGSGFGADADNLFILLQQVAGAAAHGVRPTDGSDEVYRVPVLAVDGGKLTTAIPLLDPGHYHLSIEAGGAVSAPVDFHIDPLPPLPAGLAPGELLRIMFEETFPALVGLLDEIFTDPDPTAYPGLPGYDLRPQIRQAMDMGLTHLPGCTPDQIAVFEQALCANGAWEYLQEINALLASVESEGVRAAGGSYRPPGLKRADVLDQASDGLSKISAAAGFTCLAIAGAVKLGAKCAVALKAYPVVGAIGVGTCIAGGPWRSRAAISRNSCGSKTLGRRPYGSRARESTACGPILPSGLSSRRVPLRGACGRGVQPPYLPLWGR